ncbi:MAG: chemotaxis response regulator protein-glutamate methylesterase [Xanthobacteraceae bacterium]|jgi:two-component system chemotaxis response regulator CheB
MSIVRAAASPATAVDRPIRVMVVDDAIVARRLLTRWIDAEPDLTVAACLRTGREAVEQIEDSDADVVVLDVDMPELDGISALPLLLEKKRDLVVIMASTLTRRSAEISLRALSLGAADYVPKPEAAPDASTSAAFHRELIEKIRNLGRRGRSLARQWRPGPAPIRPLPAPRRRDSVPLQPETPAFSLRPFALAVPRVLLIGSSTGGPQALTALIGQIGATSERAPILITQHMPATFTTVLAEHLTRVSGRRVLEAVQGEVVVASSIYVAPGGRHMRVVRGRDGPLVALGDDPPINFCKPAVDALLASAAEVWGAGSLALVLTGMGCDGTRGAAEIAAAGGSVIAQDEATSVVWGMPRSVAQAGLCSAVLPLGQIAAKINRLFSGDRS